MGVNDVVERAEKCVKVARVERVERIRTIYGVARDTLFAISLTVICENAFAKL